MDLQMTPARAVEVLDWQSPPTVAVTLTLPSGVECMLARAATPTIGGPR